MKLSHALSQEGESIRVSRLFFTLALTFAFAGAVIPFRTAVAENPQVQDPATFYEQGLALFKAEKFEEAAKAFNQAIKLKPDYADAYFRLGETYYEMGQFKKVVEAYKEAVRHQPDSALAYSKLGAAYADIVDYQKAIDAYKEAIRLNPKTPEAHYRLGAIYAFGDKEKANAEYRILQTLDPKLAQDLFNLVYQPPVSVVEDGTVRLSAVAIDSEGATVNGLTTEDFQVLEEGVPQAISVSSKNGPAVYAIAIDTSGSVRPVFSLAIASLKQIIDKTLPQDETMLIRFISSDKLETVQDFTMEKKKLAKAIDLLYIEGGQSAVVDAVYVTAQRVASYKFPLTSVRRVLLLLTDGEDRASYYRREQLLTLLGGLDVQIFAISFSSNGSGSKLNQNQPRQSVDLLQQLASGTGGKAFFPTSVAELKTAIDQVFDMIHAEYTIQYKPTNPIKAGVYRPVSVTILPKPGRENWTVTSRSGYVFSAK